ncbi:MAG: serine hydrolase domain-containing protein [Pseudomonadota bacterium]
MKTKRHLNRRQFGLSSIATLSCASFGCSSETASSENSLSTDALHSRAQEAFKLAQNKGLPGCIMSIKVSDAPQKLLALGIANAETNTPIETDMWMRVGSVTKLFVGYIALRLVDEGALDLDAPLSKFRDDVPYGDRITLQMLGNHTSGIYNPIYSEAFRKTINETPSRTIPRDEMLQVAFENTTNSSGIGTHLYSNANTALVADIVERVTGASMPELLRQYIFEDTITGGIEFSDSAALPSPYASGYRFGPEGGGVEYGNHFFDATAFSASWADAAGNINARLPELLIAGLKIIKGEKLKPTTRAAQRDFLQVSKKYEYGFFLEKYGNIEGHAGDVPGFSSFVGWNPKTNTGLAVLTNLSNFKDRSSPALQIAKAVFA